MNDPSMMLNPAISTDLRNTTFSQGLAAGLTHSDWLAGRKISRSLRDRALVSHSVSPERAEELTTDAIYGPLFGGSSPSCALQTSLANRLRDEMDVNGSPEYGLTWRHWAMSSGPPICALRASVRRTSGNGYTGWPTTPQASDGEGGVMKIQPGTAGKYKLRDYAQLAGYPTALSRDWKDGPGMATTGTNPDGSTRTRLDQLPGVAQLTGTNQSGGHALMVKADESPPDWFPVNGKLNPYFSLWLMGYPAEWGY